MKKTYRGEQRILAEMTNRVRNPGSIYSMDLLQENLMRMEMVFETVMIMDDSTGEFEQYIKERMVQSDLSNPRNCWNLSKKYEADMLLQKMLDDAR
jgi:hypothetical protein